MCLAQFCQKRDRRAMHQFVNVFEVGFVAIPRVGYILRAVTGGGKEQFDLAVMACGRTALHIKQMPAIHGKEIIEGIEIFGPQRPRALAVQRYAVPCGDFNGAAVWPLAHVVRVRACRINSEAVFDTGGARLGTVKAVLDHGAGDILGLSRPGQPDLLLPFTRAAVPTVDLAGRRVVADPPEGLENPARD